MQRCHRREAWSPRIPRAFRFVQSVVVAGAILGACCAPYADAGGRPPRRFLPIPSPSPMQRDTPVQVLVSKEVLGSGHVTYRYRVVNGNPFPIARVTLGDDYFYGVSELLYEPLGWEMDEAPASGTQSPPGWAFHLIPTEEDSLFMIEWEADSTSSALPGGASLDGFSVTVGGEDEAYERGHWEISTTCDDDYYPHTWFVLPERGAKPPPSSIQAHTGVRVRSGGVGDSVGIGFDTVDGARVTVFVYNPAGTLVRTLNTAYLAAGAHELVWDGRDDSRAELPDGEYFVRIWAPQGLRQARVVLARSVSRAH